MNIPKAPQRPRLRFTALARLALLMCASLSHAAFAADVAAAPAVEIEYGSPDQSVWTTKTDAQGVPGNPLLRVAAALFAETRTPWRAGIYPAPRLFAKLQDGTTPFSMLVRVPALQECCLFSHKSITTVEIRAYRRATSPPLRRDEDLAGKQVITIHGYSYGGLIKFIADDNNRVTNNVARTHAAAFRMLDNGRADYVIDYADPAREALEAVPIAGVTSDVLSQQAVYLVLSKSYPDAHGFMARLEAIAATLDIETMLGRTGADASHAPR